MNVNTVKGLNKDHLKSLGLTQVYVALCPNKMINKHTVKLKSFPVTNNDIESTIIQTCTQVQCTLHLQEKVHLYGMIKPSKTSASEYIPSLF